MLERERPDFVDIITPPETHEEMCALRRGARHPHHLSEAAGAQPTKPASASSRAAAGAGVRFMVHENFRWQPWYRAIKDVQTRGDIGEFTHVHFLMRMGDGWGADAYLARQPFFREYPRLLILRDRRALHRHVPVPARRGVERGGRDQAAQPRDPRRGRGPAAAASSRTARRRSGTRTATTSRRPNRPASHSASCASTARPAT